MDFRKLLSLDVRQEIKKRGDDLLHFQDLDQKSMAESLLDAVRKIQDSRYLSDDHRYSYDEYAVYRLVPEIAKRLSPDVVLRDFEMPDPSEKSDPVSWITGITGEKLVSSVGYSLKGVSFARIPRTEASVELRSAVEFLFDRRPNAISIAMDTLYPGSFPGRAEIDDRPPFSGYQVSAVMLSGREKVLTYKDDMAEALSSLKVYVSHLSEQDVEPSKDSEFGHNDFWFKENSSKIKGIFVRDFAGNAIDTFSRTFPDSVGIDSDQESPSL